jgi:hypothetical protein
MLRDLQGVLHIQYFDDINVQHLLLNLPAMGIKVI